MILHLERKFVLPSETFIVNQINGSTQFRHSVFTVKQLGEPGNVDAQIYQPEKVNSFFGEKKISKAAVRYFLKKTETVAPRIIHSHYITDAAFFHAFTKKLTLPKVCSCYGYDVTKFPKKYGLIARWYYKRVFKEYDYFLAMSENMADNLIGLGCPKEKIKIHYHGVDSRKFDIERNYKISKPRYILLTVGQLDPTKGHFVVLKAISKLKQSNPDISFRYIVVGDGPLKSDLQDFIQKYQLNECVEFKGFVKHGEALNDIMKEADVFVHPCITANGAVEGIPGAVVEAMSSGFPVISTYHGGIPSVISNNETGILIHENDVDMLAEKLLALYQDENLRRQLGINAKNYAQRFLDLKKQCNALAVLYSSLYMKKS